MLINLATSKYYSGLDDLVLWDWLAEGSKNSGDPIAFHL